MNQNSNKQFDLLRSNNQNGFEVHRRLLEGQNTVSPQAYIYDRIRTASSNPAAGCPQEPTRPTTPGYDPNLDPSFLPNNQLAAPRAPNSFTHNTIESKSDTVLGLSDTHAIGKLLGREGRGSSKERTNTRSLTRNAPEAPDILD